MSAVLDNPHIDRFFIGGQWVTPDSTESIDVINPATEQPVATIPNGNSVDVDRAVTAAQAAFESFSRTSVADRVGLLERIIEVYKTRIDDIATALSAEMGAPAPLARGGQARSGLAHFNTTLAALQNYEFEKVVGTTLVVQEPIGVCGLITPWNWPLNQIGAKVAPALAAGCAMVLKPSEIAPLNAVVFAEILDEAGVPAGVFNLVQGDGLSVGVPLSSHAGVDMMSFTGSTRAGIEIARNAAPTVKRVAQELGGKSANIMLPDVDIAATVSRDWFGVCENSGQSCNSGTRILVPNDRMDEAMAAARATADTIVVGDPNDPNTTIGPVVSEAQFLKIQSLIQKGIDEGATLVAGGPGRPEGLDVGFYVRPTVFGNVTNDMTIAREEIFGPVICLLGYDTIDEAVEIANDTEYGLAGYVSSNDLDQAKAVAMRLRAGTVGLNGFGLDFNAPFGGYKRSGNGREFGAYGLHEFLEYKSLFGANP